MKKVPSTQFSVLGGSRHFDIAPGTLNVKKADATIEPKKLLLSELLIDQLLQARRFVRFVVGVASITVENTVGTGGQS